MNKKNIFFIRLASAFFAVVLALVLGRSALCSDAQLKFSLILDKSEYSLREPINIVFSLKNTGAGPVIVNQRFYVSSQNASKDQKEVYFDLISPSGVKLSCQHFYETGYPKTDYFKLLAPGEEVKSDYPRNLNGYFDLTEPGTYTVAAVYRNVFGAEIGLDVFAEQLISEPVKFTIVNNKK
ncbi:MAG: hypothetical protein PHS66_04715 [Candidatus Omnitrophica bacterium]|nr:hypothetical protein [Candidatus Omnitrophota bacterium]